MTLGLSLEQIASLSQLLIKICLLQLLNSFEYKAKTPIGTFYYENII